MARYHMHKVENEITDQAEIEAILAGGTYATLAFAAQDEPYLVTLNYGYAAADRALYFHSALEGLKLAFVRANPRVCGTVIVDRGYRMGKCTHAFSSVVFWGTIELLDSTDAKRAGLEVMFDHLEEDPVSVRRRLLADPHRLKTVAILKLTIEEITGKSGQ